ncbi:MAG TPA: hypothetical protein VFE62_03360 [Gemmataceae bacterium]|nr:hypothetical protein [Gemmataceae bacterium]
MKRSDLTKEQVKPVAKVVCRQKEYLYRLRDRMQKRGFPQDDPLYQKVDAAYHAVFTLWIDLHYLSAGMKPIDHL